MSTLNETGLDVLFIGILEGNYFSGRVELFSNGVKLENLPEQHNLFIRQRYFSNAVMHILDYAYYHNLYNFSSDQKFSVKFTFDSSVVDLIENLEAF